MSRFSGFVIAIAMLIVLHDAAPAAYNVIGGDGGKPYSLQCPSGQHAVGMAARHHRSNPILFWEPIIQLRLKCVAADPETGGWAGTPGWTGWSPTERVEGTAGLDYDASTCPDDEFISERIYGTVTRVGLATVVGQLHWHCVRFDQVDREQGTSRRRLGAGQFGVGGVVAAGSEEQQSRAVVSADSALQMLYLRYGTALDSVRIGVRHMPWTEALQRPATAPGLAPRKAPRLVINPAPRTAAQPDLVAVLISVPWRYSGQTRFNGATYRKVHDSFCATAMVRHGSYSTRHFDLPDLSFRVQNAGSGAATAPFNVSSSFGGATRNEQAGPLAPGQSRTLVVPRDRRVSRCVTLGRVPGGCHECAGQRAHEDPRLEIRVDTANAVSESNENNNRLVR